MLSNAASACRTHSLSKGFPIRRQGLAAEAWRSGEQAVPAGEYRNRAENKPQAQSRQLAEFRASTGCEIEIGWQSRSSPPQSGTKFHRTLSMEPAWSAADCRSATRQAGSRESL